MIMHCRYVNLKSDLAYSLLRKTGISFYINFSYHWKELSGGIRYNKSFGNFVKAGASGIPNINASNSSMQLYNTVWRSRLRQPKESTIK
jgi:hypothetical protein